MIGYNTLSLLLPRLNISSQLLKKMGKKKGTKVENKPIINPNLEKTKENIQKIFELLEEVDKDDTNSFLSESVEKMKGSVQEALVLIEEKSEPPRFPDQKLLDKAIEEMKSLSYNDDMEYLHCVSREIFTKLLEKLGYGELINAYKGIFVQS